MYDAVAGFAIICAVATVMCSRKHQEPENSRTPRKRAPTEPAHRYKRREGLQDHRIQQAESTGASHVGRLKHEVAVRPSSPQDILNTEVMRASRLLSQCSTYGQVNTRESQCDKPKSKLLLCLDSGKKFIQLAKTQRQSVRDRHREIPTSHIAAVDPRKHSLEQVRMHHRQHDSQEYCSRAALFGTECVETSEPIYCEARPTKGSASVRVAEDPVYDMAIMYNSDDYEDMGECTDVYSDDEIV